MTNKIVISKPGKNALSETNPDNLIFSSDYNTLKYYSSGYVDVAYKKNTANILNFYKGTVAHGLSYIPFFYVLVDVESSGTFIPCPSLLGFIGYTFNISAFADSTNINFVVASRGSAGSDKTARFRYFIFKNNLGL